MAIKLIKACKELNIGMTVAAEFCRIQGVEIPTDPNARLTDEMFLALAREFNKDMALKLEAERQSHERFERVMHVAENILPTTTEETHDDGVFRLGKPTLNSKPRVVGSISLDDKVSSGTPKVGDIIEGVVKSIKDFGVFVDCGFMDGLVHISELAENPNVKPQQVVKIRQKVRVKVLKIDIGNKKLNLSLKKANDSTSSNIKKKNNITDERIISDISQDIKNLWDYYINIQEYLLQEKSRPIAIKSDTIDFRKTDGKFYVEIDDENKNQIQQVMAKDLHLEEFDLNDKFVYVDSLLWNTMSPTEKERIKTKLSLLNADLNIIPTVDVDIKYGQDIERSDLLTYDELHEMDKAMQEGTTIHGEIDDIAAFICKVKFDQEFHIYNLFGEHAIRQHSNQRLTYNLRYANSYIPEETYTDLSKNIGLTLKNYCLYFKVNDDDAIEYLTENYEVTKKVSDSSVQYSKAKNAFVFVRKITAKCRYKTILEKEIPNNIATFINGMKSYYTGDNVEIACDFNYSFERDKFNEHLARELYQHLMSSGIEGVSLSSRTQTIGIDFKWRYEKLQDKINAITSLMPGVIIELSEAHKFKCKVQNSFVGYDKLKEVLEDTFENIRIIHDDIKQSIYIRLDCPDYEFYGDLKALLLKKLDILGYSESMIKTYDSNPEKVRLSFSFDAEGCEKDKVETLSELRLSDFAFEIDGKTIPFGRLLKIEYPKLYFDVSDQDDRKNELIIEVLQNKSVDYFVPVLTGDREKLSRLKTTYGKATSGSGLLNGNMSQFMFDSSLATETEDIHDIIKPDGVAYSEIEKNLLNKHINKSQKKAILKAMYAEDLAVIQGPPGTGKSTAISELMWQLIRRGFSHGESPETILLTSETNLAVDNAIARTINNKTNLVKPIRFGDDEKLAPEGLQFSLKLMSEWVEHGDVALEDEYVDSEGKVNLVLKNWLDNISRRSFMGYQDGDIDVINRWRKILAEPSREIRELVLHHYQRNCNVIGATCSSIGVERADRIGNTSFYRNYQRIFPHQNDPDQPVSFTTVIQDESSKATPAELIQPFIYGKRAIVIGDHRQLPPMLDQEEIENVLKVALDKSQSTEESETIKRLQTLVKSNFKELEISHFQRLYEKVDSSLKATFNMQYRMHPDINEVIEQFYKEDGGLKCGWVIPEDAGVNDPDMTNPASRYHGINIDGILDENTHVLFINSDSPEMMDGTSRVNIGEIEVVDKLLSYFENSESYQNFINHYTAEEDKQIGIISFYGKQVRLLSNIAAKHTKLPLSRVSTVDRFQGMERNVVIVSMVRSNRIQASRNQMPNLKKYPYTGGYPEQKSLGFAQSPNRLNVALSRARRLLIIIGNEELFTQKEIYRNLFDTIRNNPNNRILNSSQL